MTKLYSPRLLSLAASLANHPLNKDYRLTSELRSRTCGSVVALGADVDQSDRIVAIGLRVSACAVGQSSAAIMADAAEGRSLDEFVQAYEQIDSWLGGVADLPDWPQMDALEPALPHSGRHEAIRLPWKAMITALSSTEAAS